MRSSFRLFVQPNDLFLRLFFRITHGLSAGRGERERERERESFFRVICLLTEHEGCKVCYGHIQGHIYKDTYKDTSKNTYKEVGG